MNTTKFLRYENKLLVLLSFTFGFVLFDRMALSFLVPFFDKELGLDNTQIGLLSSMLALAWANSGSGTDLTGTYAHLYQGCPAADSLNKQWAFYRYHIQDPVFFNRDCRVAIQQMGADNRENVRIMAKAGAHLETSSRGNAERISKLLERNPEPDLSDTTFPDGLIVVYRLDNYSATAYYYLDKPIHNLPSLPALN